MIREITAAAILTFAVGANAIPAHLDNGGVVLSDEVKVSINLETQKQKDEAAKGK